MMTRKLQTTVLAVLLVLSFSAAAFAVDYNGYISIDSVEAHRGDKFSVPVWLHGNSVAFSALAVPIRYNSPYLTLDSVSFVGSIKPEAFTGIDQNEADLHLVKISYIPPIGSATPPPTINASDGIVARLFFTLSDQAAAGFIPFDSANIDEYIVNGSDTVANKWIGIVLSDEYGDTAYFPSCQPGGVNVLVPTGVNDGTDDILPDQFALSQNYPNPFNPTTRIEFSVPASGPVKLEVFNVLGQSMAVLFDGTASAGIHHVDFDAARYPSGIYFYRFVHNGGSETRKMVLLK